MSVVSPIAETVATTRMPRSRASTRRRATWRIFSGSATDEPPNFMTTVSGVASGAVCMEEIVAGPSGYRCRVPRKVMLIGLDCAEPIARPRALARRAADALRSHGARLVRSPDLGDPADHRARMVLHDVLEDARRPRRLRLPQPLGPHVRGRLHRDERRDPRAAALGSRHARGRLVGGPQRPRDVPAAAAQRRHGQLLPDAVAREQVHVPGRAPRRDRRGRRRVHLRHEGLPDRRQGLPAAPGLRDDRPPLPARRAPRGDEAVDVLRDGRDGAGPDASRVLEVHGSGAPKARARERSTRTRSSTTTATSTG